jgi:hypothetical protein
LTGPYKIEGTPRTLEELTRVLGMRYLMEIDHAGARADIRDYMSQKFGKARLKATPEVDAALKDLWRDLTGEEL